MGLNIETVKASGTIYIRANGDVEGTDKIERVGEYGYIFTDNINDYIVVERDNIVVDGAGYTTQDGMSGDLPLNAGLELSSRSNVTIKNMKIRMKYSLGIRLSESSNNTISGVNVTNCWLGIHLSDSSNNIFRNNNMTDNTYNFLINSGNNISGFYNDIDVSNTVDGKPMYYWINQHDKQIPYNASYVALVNCERITVQNLNLSSNGQGILLVNTTESTITKNNITESLEEDISVLWSSNNTICENNPDEILLSLSSNNTILGNTMRYVYMFSSSNNTILGNTITGVYVLHSSNNTISDNTYWYIKLHDSPYNIFRNNYAYKFEVEGSKLEHFIQDIDESNTVNEKPIYYWVNKRNMTVPSDAGYVGLVNCTQMMIQDLNIKDNTQGILIAYTKNSTIRRNTLTDNNYGVQLVHSSHIDIYENTAVNCKNGIHFKDSSSNNHIHRNTIIGYHNGVSNGVSIDASFDNTISGNNITSNHKGIQLRDSSTNNISDNILTNNSNGILFFKSSDNSITNNNMTANTYGVNLEHDSYNNEISENYMAKNLNAIYLRMSSDNSIHSNEITSNKNLGIGLSESSNYNSIHKNNIANNKKGLFLGKGYFYGPSVYNKIYQNNFIHNNEQVIISTPGVNYLDNGYPSGGNYWSDYEGVDSNDDGIGDTPYVIDENNRDNYPIMVPYIPPAQMRVLYYDLMEKLNELLLRYNLLNQTCQELFDNTTNLQGQIDSLNSTLQEQIGSLNSTVQTGQEYIINELSTIRNIIYILTAAIIILMATTVYFAIRKPKTKP